MAFFNHGFNSQFIACAGITESIKSVTQFWVPIFSRLIQVSHFPVEKLICQKVFSYLPFELHQNFTTDLITNMAIFALRLRNLP